MNENRFPSLFGKSVRVNKGEKGTIVGRYGNLLIIDLDDGGTVRVELDKVEVLGKWNTVGFDS